MKTSNQPSFIIMSNSFIRNMLLLIMCPDVITSCFHFEYTKMKCYQKKKRIDKLVECNFKSEQVCFLFLLPPVVLNHFPCHFPPDRVKVLNFTFTALVSVAWASSAADFTAGYGPPQRCNCQKCADLADAHSAEGSWHWEDADNWFMLSGKKSGQLIPGNGLKLQHAWVVVAGVHDLK